MYPLMQKLWWIVAFCPAVMWAQGDRGIITGTVTDSVGAVIAGAKVTATHLDTNRRSNATTTEAGEFNLRRFRWVAIGW
jgi:hypothetical protein